MGLRMGPRELVETRQRSRSDLWDIRWYQKQVHNEVIWLIIFKIFYFSLKIARKWEFSVKHFLKFNNKKEMESPTKPP